MAKMDLPDVSAAEQLLQEIRARYRQLQRLPRERHDLHRRTSPAYLQLEAEIRGLSKQYADLTSQSDASAFVG